MNDFNETMPEGDDGGFGDFMASVDALVMGRKTFESVRDMEGGPWPYGDTPWVLTKGGVEIPELLKGKVKLTKGSPQEILEELAASGAKDVYVDGGETIRGFLDAGLLSRIIIRKVRSLPWVKGDLKIYGEGRVPTIQEVSSKPLSCGILQVTYACT